MRSTLSLAALLACCLSAPCGTEEPPKSEQPAEAEADSGDCSCQPDKKSPRTLFEWAGKEDANGNGEAEEADDTIVTDRPDFTEASSTVGRGRIQLEAGYTFTTDGDGPSRFHGHSCPEALFRIGLFADWFELRVGKNFLNETTTGPGTRFSGDGADDLYLGVKLGLTEQEGALPELALILQTTVPTGADAFTAGQMLPGVNLLYGWDVIEDFLTLGGSTQVNRALDDSGHFYVETAQSLTVGYSLADKVGAYTEWFAFFPTSAIDPGTGPEYYLDGGFTYLVTRNFQLDIRAGFGLNDRSDDFFTGAGFAVRY